MNKCHEEQVANLSEQELQEVHAHVQHTTERLHRAFAPDHFNYAFLQNQDRHVHLHVIPRYARARMVAGVRFEDPDYPGHYSVPAPSVASRRRFWMRWRSCSVTPANRAAARYACKSPSGLEVQARAGGSAVSVLPERGRIPGSSGRTA